MGFGFAKDTIFSVIPESNRCSKYDYSGLLHAELDHLHPQIYPNTPAELVFKIGISLPIRLSLQN